MGLALLSGTNVLFPNLIVLFNYGFTAFLLFKDFVLFVFGVRGMYVCPAITTGADFRVSTFPSTIMEAYSLFLIFMFSLLQMRFFFTAFVYGFLQATLPF